MAHQNGKPHEPAEDTFKRFLTESIDKFQRGDLTPANAQPFRDESISDAQIEVRRNVGLTQQAAELFGTSQSGLPAGSSLRDVNDALQARIDSRAASPIQFEPGITKSKLRLLEGAAMIAAAPAAALGAVTGATASAAVPAIELAQGILNPAQGIGNLVGDLALGRDTVPENFAQFAQALGSQEAGPEAGLFGPLLAGRQASITADPNNALAAEIAGDVAGGIGAEIAGIAGQLPTRITRNIAPSIERGNVGRSIIDEVRAGTQGTVDRVRPVTDVAASVDDAGRRIRPPATESEIADWQRRFEVIARRTAASEKHTPLSPIEQEAFDSAQITGDWESFSRVRGYTDAEIVNFQAGIDGVNEGLRLGLDEDTIMSIEGFANGTLRNPSTEIRKLHDTQITPAEATRATTRVAAQKASTPPPQEPPDLARVAASDDRIPPPHLPEEQIPLGTVLPDGSASITDEAIATQEKGPAAGLFGPLLEARQASITADPGKAQILELVGDVAGGVGAEIAGIAGQLPTRFTRNIAPVIEGGVVGRGILQEAGTAAQTPVKAARGAADRIRPIIDVAAADRPILSPAVKRQVAGTKVVDDAGEPLVVFHGSGNVFQKFDPGNQNEDALYGPGAYFTDSPDTASGYARTTSRRRGSEAAPNITPVALKLNRVLDMDAAMDEELAAPFFRISERFADSDEMFIGDGIDFLLQGRESPRLLKAISDAGGDFSVQVSDEFVRENGTNGDLWTAIAGAHQSKTEANQFFNSQGIDGFTHIGGARTNSPAHRVYIAIGDSAVMDAGKAPETALEAQIFSAIDPSPSGPQQITARQAEQLRAAGDAFQARAESFDPDIQTRRLHDTQTTPAEATRANTRVAAQKASTPPPQEPPDLARVAASDDRIPPPHLPDEQIPLGTVLPDGSASITDEAIARYDLRQTDIDAGLSRRQRLSNSVREAIEPLPIHPRIKRTLGTTRDEIIEPIAETLRSIVRRGESLAANVSGELAPQYKRLFRPADNGGIASLQGIDPAIRGIPTIQDIAARLPNFEEALNPEQLTFMNRLRELTEPERQLLRQTGDEFGQRKDIIEGGFYLPRGNAASGDEPIRVAGGGRPGSTPGFQRAAALDSMAQGLDVGYVYPEFALSLEGFINRTAKTVSDRFFSNYMGSIRDASGQKFGMSAKELAMARDPRLVERMDALRVESQRLGALSKATSQRTLQMVDRFINDPLFGNDIKDLDDMRNAVSSLNVRSGQNIGQTAQEVSEAKRNVLREIAAIRPLYKRALDSVSTRGRGRIGRPDEFPQLNGLTFPERMAARGNEVVEELGIKDPGVIDTLEGMWRGANATADNSAPGIQGLIVGPMNPKAFTKAMQANLHAWGSDAAYSDFIQDFNLTKGSGVGRLDVTDWSSSGLVQRTTGTEELTASGLERLPFVGGQFFQRANRGFNTMNNTARLGMADDLLIEEMAKGRSLQEIRDSGDIREISAMVNKATGYVNGEFKHYNRINFAPRFLAARIATLMKATKGLDVDTAFDLFPQNLARGLGTDKLRVNKFSTLEDRLARRAIVRLIGFGVLTTTGANALRGKDTDFQPIRDGKPNPNFMKIREVPFGGIVDRRDVSVFGPWDSIAGMITSVASGEKEQFLRRAVSAPIASFVWDLIGNEDFIGRPIYNAAGNTLEQTAQMFQYFGESLTPFAAGEGADIIGDIAQGAQDGSLKDIGLPVLRGLLEGHGIKNSPLSSAELRALSNRPETTAEERMEINAELARRKQSFRRFDE